MDALTNIAEQAVETVVGIIDEQLCIGCAKCVEGCNRFGNGSLYLQVRHDACVNCNVCAISRTCPGDAFVRVPSSNPYLLKTTH